MSVHGLVVAYLRAGYKNWWRWCVGVVGKRRSSTSTSTSNEAEKSLMKPSATATMLVQGRLKKEATYLTILAVLMR